MTTSIFKSITDFKTFTSKVNEHLGNFPLTKLRKGFARAIGFENTQALYSSMCKESSAKKQFTDEYYIADGTDFVIIRLPYSNESSNHIKTVLHASRLSAPDLLERGYYAIDNSNGKRVADIMVSLSDDEDKGSILLHAYPEVAYQVSTGLIADLASFLLIDYQCEVGRLYQRLLQLANKYVLKLCSEVREEKVELGQTCITINGHFIVSGTRSDGRINIDIDKFQDIAYQYLQDIELRNEFDESFLLANIPVLLTKNYLSKHLTSGILNYKDGTLKHLTQNVEKTSRALIDKYFKRLIAKNMAYQVALFIWGTDGQSSLRDFKLDDPHGAVEASLKNDLAYEGRKLESEIEHCFY